MVAFHGTASPASDLRDGWCILIMCWPLVHSDVFPEFLRADWYASCRSHSFGTRHSPMECAELSTVTAQTGNPVQVSRNVCFYTVQPTTQGKRPKWYVTQLGPWRAGALASLFLWSAPSTELHKVTWKHGLVFTRWRPCPLGTCAPLVGRLACGPNQLATRTPCLAGNASSEWAFQAVPQDLQASPRQSGCGARRPKPRPSWPSLISEGPVPSQRDTTAGATSTVDPPLPSHLLFNRGLFYLYEEASPRRCATRRPEGLKRAPEICVESYHKCWRGLP